MRFIRRRGKAGAGVAEARPTSELERARRQAEESARRAREDLARERRKLQEGENLVAVIRRLHERNHVGADISKIIGQGYGRGR